MRRNMIVSPVLPYAGLGNMLLVWARAILFARINSIPVLAPNWNHVHIGPWLRGERVKRYYGNLFSSRKYKSHFYYDASSVFNKKRIYRNPEILEIDPKNFDSSEHHVFLFDTMPPWNDYFQDLKHFHALIKQELYDSVREKVMNEIMARPDPEIAIHIRRSDFQLPQPNQIYSIDRCVQTPLDWYKDALLSVRKMARYDVPATIFSDAYTNEIMEILDLPNVSISSEKSAISDIITMSRSKLLIGSAHSSFSAWAAYLGQLPTMWDSTRASLYEPIFVGATLKKTYEGGFDPSNKNFPILLKENICSLFELKS
jgi:hypothetical protein